MTSPRRGAVGAGHPLTVDAAAEVLAEGGNAVEAMIAAAATIAAVLATARGYVVTGYVKNRPDGTVELIAEGQEPEVERFLAEVAEAMSGNIHEATADTGGATGEFEGFEIRY